jgi:hypothetical protein
MTPTRGPAAAATAADMQLGTILRSLPLPPCLHAYDSAP